VALIRAEVAFAVPARLVNRAIDPRLAAEHVEITCTGWIRSISACRSS